MTFELSFIVSSVSGLFFRINNSLVSDHRNQIRISPETTSPPLSPHFRVGLGVRCTYEIKVHYVCSMNIESWYTWKTTNFKSWMFIVQIHLVVFQNTSTELVTRKYETTLVTLVSKNIDDFGTLTTLVENQWRPCWRVLMTLVTKPFVNHRVLTLHRDPLAGTRWGLKDSVDFHGLSRRDTSGTQLPWWRVYHPILSSFFLV